MIVARINQIGDSLRLRLSEWGLAAILFGWGWLLLLPYPTFGNPSFAEAARLAPEWAWGAACLTLGSARLAVLVVNGAWTRSPHARAVAAFLSCFIWVQIILAFWRAGTVSTALAVYPALLTMDIISVFRASADARLSDDIEARKNGRP